MSLNPKINVNNTRLTNITVFMHPALILHVINVLLSAMFDQW